MTGAGRREEARTTLVFRAFITGSMVVLSGGSLEGS